MPDAVSGLLAILDLEPIERNLFRGNTHQAGWERRVFGGQVICQALIAASRTVDPARPAHSLHAYFLRPGDPSAPIVYDVDRIRDGKSFTTRRVVAIQHGEPTFSMSVSFHGDEPGLVHQTKMPAVPPPEALPDRAAMRAGLTEHAPLHVVRFLSDEQPIEFRFLDPARLAGRDPLEPAQGLWLRTAGPLPDDPAVHRCALAFASDLTLLDTALFPHGRTVLDSDLQSASLDHAMWFHRPFRADDWLLYVQESTVAAGARGFSRGQVFSRDGALVASVAQEGLIRVRA